MHSVYCYSASVHQESTSEDELTETRLSPPILLIGTHRNQFPNGTKKSIVTE